MKVSRLRILFLCCIFAWPCAVLRASDSELQDGIAIVTTRSGEVALIDASGRAQNLELHAVRPISDTTLRTGKAGHLILALSNGMALGLDADTELQVMHYRQLPYPRGKESLEYEASRSMLRLKLIRGSLYFDSQRISPLSEFVIHLPTGELHPHKSSGRIDQNDTGSHITIAKGIVTFNFPGEHEEEFINGPDRTRISMRSAADGHIAETIPPEQDEARERTDRMLRAVWHANSRVIYTVPENETSIPHPVLIARPEDLRQPSPRPYRYLD